MTELEQAVHGCTCAVQRALRYVEAFLAEPMCGRCFPCALGVVEARARLESLACGEGGADDVEALRRIARLVQEGSMCRKGKDCARFLADAIAAPGFEEHAAGACPEGQCQPLRSYSVTAESCVRCGACKEVCTQGAIVGERMLAFRRGYPPFEIRQKRCERCGACAVACTSGAIRVSGSIAAGREEG